MKTSEFLLDYLAETDAAFAEDTGEDPKAVENTKRLVSQLTRVLVGSLESFADAQAVKLSGLVGEASLPLENFFDEHYTKQLLKRIPKMTRRTMKLSQIVAARTSSPKVERYLKEATRTYIFGFWAGSVALSRAAMEQGLKDSLNSKLAMQDLLETAVHRRILDGPHREMAAEVQWRGNECLHQTSSIPSESDAWATLCAARGVLGHIFSRSSR